MRNYIIIASVLFWGITACQSSVITEEKNNEKKIVLVKANEFVTTSKADLKRENDLLLNAGSWASYEVPITVAGRYQVEVLGSAENGGTVWLEAYINNTDGRTYNITGTMPFTDGIAAVDGSPLDTGLHQIKLHVNEGSVKPTELRFMLMHEHEETPVSLTQNMNGEDWELVWSDEFEGNGLPDSTKWSYNVGDWGWGNNELQYYTKAREKNARQENGALVIEAHKNDLEAAWTSARLTTQGRISFLYGKVEFRAKVPVGRGTWTAGWLLGDDFRDEKSWPYCGEIDVLECVGYEIDDETGNGINHASCHTRAYYFKQGNQITSTTEVKNMSDEWHTYSVEWYPDVIYMSVDGERYYTYDKTANELEWPFGKPQNILLNLAIGGGMGGAQGVDQSWESHKYLVDYVRVYELK